MGLSTRELYLIIRARDEASRVLTGLGTNIAKISSATIAARRAQAAALSAAGAGMMAIGAATIGVLNNMGKANTDYAQSVATSFTQVEDKATDSMKGLSDLGLRTAQKFAVNFKEIQPAIYDIFSSVEDKGKNAAKILEGIAKAAVGGATDMETAGNSIIGVLNAWNLKAKDVGRVNDQMFQLVRKGRGTFQQFTAAMGKAIPSAKNAGQSIEEVSAMLMLLTRNGVTTAMAGTSAARAMDLLANPRFQVNMKSIGMSVYDSSGKMKAMSTVIEEMRQKFKDLSPEKRANELKGLLGGAGNNIQARRFLNLALGETNHQYKQMLIYAKDAGGAADEAYKIMANTPQAKMQLLANEVEVFKVTFGEAVTSVKVFIAEALTPLLKAFNSLSPQMKQTIIIVTGVGAVLSIVVGAVLAAAGAIMLFEGLGVTIGAVFGAVAWPILAVVAAVAALAAGGYLLYQNWDAVVAWWNGVWQEMQRVVQPFVGWINARMQDLADGWEWFMAAVGPAIDAFGQAMQNLMNNIGPIFNWIVGAILAFLVPAWQMIATVVGKVLGGIGSLLGGFINVLSGVINFIVALFTGNWQALWDATQQIFSGLLQMIVGVFQTLGGLLWGVLWGVINGIIGFFTYLWDVIVGHSIIPDLINAIVEWFKKLPGWVYGVVSGFVSGVVGFIRELPGKAIAAVSPFVSGIRDKAVEAWEGFKSAVSTGISNAITTVKELPGKIKDALGGAIGWLKNVGENVIQGLINGIRSMWDNAVGWITRLGNAVVDAAKRAFNQNSPSKVFYDIGVNNVKGLINGTMSMQNAVNAAYAGLVTAQYDTAGNLTFGLYGNTTNSVVTGPGSSNNNDGNKIDITVNTQEIDPVKHSADLGYELAARLNL
ncbi:MAG TPA: phage tail tape measure protein [Rectinema sp.]|nr:phage tail tape measure protein [Rectinema sp.]